MSQTVAPSRGSWSPEASTDQLAQRPRLLPHRGDSARVLPPQGLPNTAALRRLRDSICIERDPKTGIFVLFKLSMPTQ